VSQRGVTAKALCAGAGSLGGLFIFFFQAEDGIRDLIVTGVQTCALPILLVFSWDPIPAGLPVAGIGSQLKTSTMTPSVIAYVARSEERRVGKECRARLASSRCKNSGNDRLGALSSAHSSDERINPATSLR